MNGDEILVALMEDVRVCVCVCGVCDDVVMML
jgi:hypothetical protein